MKRIVKWIKKQIEGWFFLFILFLGGLIFCRWTEYGGELVRPYVKAAGWLEAEVSAWRGDMPGEREQSEEQEQPGESEEALQTEPEEGGGESSIPEAEAPEESLTGGEETISEGGDVLTVEETLENREPVYRHVEDDYFADAVFIGDSRTVGLSKYGGLENTATFYASTGLTIFKLFEAPVAPVPGEKTMQTVDEALRQRQFGKIYLMLGINEMGRGDVDGFIQTYQEAVNHLRELQPEAIIYLQGIMRVSAERDAKGDYINNAGINERNERIALLADNQKVFYLDVNPVVCDENGTLIQEYTFDGVHLLGKYCTLWKDFLKDHAVVLD